MISTATVRINVNKKLDFLILWLNNNMALKAPNHPPLIQSENIKVSEILVVALEFRLINLSYKKNRKVTKLRMR